MIVPGGNLWADIPASLPAERFDPLLRSATCRLERIVSIGHATPAGEWYDQDRDEWVALLQGRAGLRFADEDDARARPRRFSLDSGPSAPSGGMDQPATASDLAGAPF